MPICANFDAGSCKCQDTGGLISDPPAHTCVFCSAPIHAICGRALTALELRTYAPDKDDEGSGSHRVCRSCDSTQQRRFVETGARVLPQDDDDDLLLDEEGEKADEIRPGPVPGAAVPRTTLENREAEYPQSPRLLHNPNEELFLEAEFDTDDDNDDYVFRDEEYSSGDDEEYVPDWDEILVRHQDVTVEIDDLDKFAVQMGCGDVLHVLEEAASRFDVSVETMLDSPPSPKQILDLFLSNSVLASLCDAASEGIRIRGVVKDQTSVCASELTSYIQVLLMCSVYDVSPSQLLDAESGSRWYDATEIKRRISWARFRDIRDGLTVCLGLSPRDKRFSVGASSLSWHNCRADVPAATTTVEQTVSAANAALTLCPHSSILGIDDDQLRYASRCYREKCFRTGDGAKGMGIHATTLTSTITGLTSALHTSVRGETVPELLSSLLMLAVRCPSPRYASDMLAGSIICIDRGYATKDVIDLLTSEGLAVRFVATLKKSKTHPVTFGNTEPAEWQKSLSSKGMRELVVFRRTCRSGDQVFAVGYRDIGNKPHGILIQYSGIAVIKPFSFSLKPRNRVSWKEDVMKFTASPANLLADKARDAEATKLGVEAIVQHEDRNVVLMSYGQSKDHVWWILRTTGITSTVSHLLCSCALKNHSYVRSMCGDELFIQAMRILSEFCNIGRPSERAELWRTSAYSPSEMSRQGTERASVHNGLVQGRAQHNEGASEAENTRIQTVSEFVKARTIDEIKRTCVKGDLITACRQFGLEITGTKEKLAERLVREASRNSGSQPENQPPDSSPKVDILKSFDTRLFQKPRKSTSAQASGSANEENIINAIPHVFETGDQVRIQNGQTCKQHIAAIVKRGLVQSRSNVRMLASVDGVAAIQSIPLEGSASPTFDLAVVEVKTRHGKHFVNAEAIAADLGTQRYALVEITDVDIHWAMRNARESSARTASGLSLFRRYIPDSEHRSQLLHHMAVYGVDWAIYAVGGPRSLSYIVDVKDISRIKLRNCLHTVARSMLMAGLEDLFSPTRPLPSEVDTESYFQNAESRELHYGIAERLLCMARSKREPLPEAKYVRPMIVRMWNELGKTGTDTFSRQAVEVFPHRCSTKGGISKIIHRQIIVCVTNALYTYRLVRTLSCARDRSKSIPSLLEELTFAGLRRKMAAGTTMKSFIRDALEEDGLPRPNSISIASRFSGHNFPSASPDMIEGPQTPTRRMSKPKKRDFIRIFNTEKGKNIRLKGNHTPFVPEDLRGVGANGKTCWICGPLGGPEKEPSNTRFRPKTICLVCYSPFLCTTRHYSKGRDGVVRRSNQSCFDYFHSTPVIRKRQLLSRNLKRRSRARRQSRNINKNNKGSTSDEEKDRIGELGGNTAVLDRNMGTTRKVQRRLLLETHPEALQSNQPHNVKTPPPPRKTYAKRRRIDTGALDKENNNPNVD